MITLYALMSIFAVAAIVAAIVYRAERDDARMQRNALYRHYCRMMGGESRVDTVARHYGKD